MRGAGVFIGANGGKSRIRPGSEIEEAGVCRVRNHGWSIGVPFTEEAKAKLSDILHFPRERLGEFMLNTKVDAADFGVVQMIRNGANAAATGRACGSEWRQHGSTGNTGKRIQHCLTLGSGVVNGYSPQSFPVKVQRIQDYVVERQHRTLGEGELEQRLLPGSIGETQPRLPVVLVRGARGNNPVALETCAVRTFHRAALECAGLVVIPQASVHRQLPRYFPGILIIKAIDVILGGHLSWTKTNGKCRRRGRVRKVAILSKVKLLKQRKPRIVADIEPCLHRVLAVCPGQVVQVLISLLQPPLGTTKGGPSIKRRMLLSWQCSFVRERVGRPEKPEAGFIHQVRSQRGNKPHVNAGIMNIERGERIGRDVVARLNNQVVEELAIHMVTDVQNMLLRDFVIYLASVKKIVGGLLHD